MFVEEFFVLCDPERQHRAANRAVGNPDGCGVGNTLK